MNVRSHITFRDFSAEVLDYYFSYDPPTGVIRWKNAPTAAVVVGDIATLSFPGISKPYNIIGIGNAIIKASNVAYSLMTGAVHARGLIIDHIDGDSLNDKWDNLRAISPKDNNHNRQRARYTASENVIYPGVSYDPDGDNRPWTVKHQVEGTTVMRTYPCALDALCAKRSLQLLLSDVRMSDVTPRVRRGYPFRAYLPNA